MDIPQGIAASIIAQLARSIWAALNSIRKIWKTRRSQVAQLTCNARIAKRSSSVVHAWSPMRKHIWSTNVKSDAKRKATCLVCTTCYAKGCTARDPALYACRICSEELGSTKFNGVSLKHFKYNAQRQLACKTCEETEAGRLKGLQKELRKSKAFCNCSCQMHTERCHLSPRFCGERRWFGSDGFITPDDRKFLDQLNPRPVWWSKAWCKK